MESFWLQEEREGVKLPEWEAAHSGYGNVWFTLVCVAFVHADSFDSALAFSASVL